jgi:hypothetical protein
LLDVLLFQILEVSEGIVEQFLLGSRVLWAILEVHDTGGLCLFSDGLSEGLFGEVTEVFEEGSLEHLIGKRFLNEGTKGLVVVSSGFFQGLGQEAFSSGACGCGLFILSDHNSFTEDNFP